jgi:GGDEF domain-containing protein
VTLLLAALQKSLLHKRELSRVDSLTGTINGRYFMEVMQVEIERSRRYSRPFTLVYLDVATIIRSHLRTTDSVARLGGMGLFSPAQGLPCPFYYNHYASNC